MILDIDPAKCTGCMLCVLYCSLTHEYLVMPTRARIHVLANRDRLDLVPVACIPCESKPCLAACPEPGAIQVSASASGAVIVREELCTACGKCARACEIGAIQIVRIPGRGKKGKAVALKCDQCGGEPWCTRVCSPGALVKTEGQHSSQAVYERLVEAKAKLESREVQP